MAIPSKVLEDIELGKEYFCKLNAEYISELKKGCDGCFPKDYICLQEILRDLGYKVEQDNFDDVALTLYNKMMLIIGGVAYVPPVLSNTTYTGTGTPTTEEQILAGLATSYTEETGLIALFSNTDYLINFLAIPILAPIPTQYVNLNNPFDTGMIGSPSDLFGAFTEIGDFRVTVTNYPIPLTDTYLFS